jgi:hypothetical protein
MQGVLLKTGSDDEAKVYLNGEEVLNQGQPRPIAKDQDTTPVTLRKGVNALVLKVINHRGGWAGCVRFTDADGQPLDNLKVTLTPDPVPQKGSPRSR